MIRYSKNIKNLFSFNQIVSYSATTSQVKSIDDIPGPFCLPVIGSSWNFFPVVGKWKINKINEYSEYLLHKYGQIVREKSGSFNIIHLYDPKDFEKVYNLCNKPNHQLRLSFFLLKSFRDKRPHLYKSGGLLAQLGEPWWNIRKISQKIVSPLKEVRLHLKTDDDIIKEFVDKIVSLGTIEDVMTWLNRLSMELTLMYMFGKRFNSFDDPQTDENSHLTKLMRSTIYFTETVTLFDLAQFYWSRPTANDYKEAEKHYEFVEKFVLNEIKELSERGNIAENKCILAQLLREPDLDRELGAIIDLLYAGIDTTAVTETFILYEIGKNKNIQNKLREEALNCLPKGKNSALTDETFNNIKFLKAVMKECLRIHPIVPIQNRQLPQSIELSGYNIPKDAIVLFEIYSACRMKENFKDPLNFNPERWMKSSIDYEYSHPYILLPFGIGIRTCIARRRAEQLIQMLILRILTEYEVNYIGEEISTVTTFLLRPEKPVKITFTKL